MRQQTGTINIENRGSIIDICEKRKINQGAKEVI